MNYMTAMEAAAAAEMAAGTHALGLFTSANAYDVVGTGFATTEKVAEEEVASVGAAIAAAAERGTRRPSRRRRRYCYVGCRRWQQAAK